MKCYLHLWREFDFQTVDLLLICEDSTSRSWSVTERHLKAELEFFEYENGKNLKLLLRSELFFVNLITLLLLIKPKLENVVLKNKIIYFLVIMANGIRNKVTLYEYVLIGFVINLNMIFSENKWGRSQKLKGQ